MIRARFFVPGTPAPQGSKNIYRGRPVESSKRLPAWRAAIEAEACVAHRRIGYSLAGPLRLDCTFWFKRPKKPAHYYPSIDLDKLTRAVGDALQKSGLIINDSQLSTLGNIRKRWTLAGDRTGALITLLDDDLGLV